MPRAVILLDQPQVIGFGQRIGGILRRESQNDQRAMDFYCYGNIH